MSMRPLRVVCWCLLVIVIHTGCESLPPPCESAFSGRPTPEPAQIGEALKEEAKNLCGVNLKGASIEELVAPGANFSYAFLVEAKVPRAFLMGANFSGARLDGANLSDTNLGNANLTGASLIKANMHRSSLLGADLTSIVFEPAELPDIDAIAYAKNLWRMRFGVNPAALVKLRKAFEEAGYEEQSKEVTYAIRHTEMLRLIQLDRPQSLIRLEQPLSLIDGVFRYLFFELPTRWGLAPGRALRILLALVPIFALPYMIALHRAGPNGIWRRWEKERLRSDLGTKEPQRIRVGWKQAIGIGIQFSILSAFTIGWRELNMADWLQRLQPKEYALHATGWVRTVSGAQALVSVYLLAMWALTYFGQPFK